MNTMRAKILRFVCPFAIATVGHMSSALQAQTVVAASGGTELRFLGDTIWRVRDTTMNMVVFRADTIIRANFVHGRLTGTTRYLASGDASVMIDDKDGEGKPRNQSMWGRVGPDIMAGAERTMIESAIRSKEMNDRMSGMMRSMEPPASPIDKHAYPFSANLVIEHHVDTVRYIRGCAQAPPVDTTVFVLFANDSVRRLSPAPRSFDRMMAAAVRGDMGRVFLSQRVSSRDVAIPGLPGPPKWPCDKR
jgi:hypothetical protein